MHSQKVKAGYFTSAGNWHKYYTNISMHIVLYEARVEAHLQCAGPREPAGCLATTWHSVQAEVGQWFLVSATRNSASLKSAVMAIFASCSQSRSPCLLMDIFGQYQIFSKFAVLSIHWGRHKRIFQQNYVHGFTQATLSFSGVVQEGRKLVLPVNNHVDSGLVWYRWRKGSFPKFRIHLKLRENRWQIYLTPAAIFVHFVTCC